MKHLLATVFLALLATTANAALITYDVNRTIGVGGGTVTGWIEIEIDFASGLEQTLVNDDFKRWSLAITAENLNLGSTTEINAGVVTDTFYFESNTDNTGGLVLNGDAVTATASGLFYNFEIDGQLELGLNILENLLNQTRNYLLSCLKSILVVFIWIPIQPMRKKLSRAINITQIRKGFLLSPKRY